MILKQVYYNYLSLSLFFLVFNKKKEEINPKPLFIIVKETTVKFRLINSAILYKRKKKADYYNFISFILIH